MTVLHSAPATAEHHHNGDALLGTQVVVLGRHGNTLHEVLHLLLETAVSS